MLNVFQVSETLVNHIRSNYPDDIAIIAYYGSYAQGTASKRSDLDFFFIPATSDGYRASIQFILDDISFDFWPISWERAERMASFEEFQTTIIADCKLLYVRSDEDHDRFMKLRDMISTLQQPENTRRLIEKAESELRDVYVHLYKLSLRGQFRKYYIFPYRSSRGFNESVTKSCAVKSNLFHKRLWQKQGSNFTASDKAGSLGIFHAHDNAQR